MKASCEKCSKDLEDGSLLCSECGFEGVDAKKESAVGKIKKHMESNKKIVRIVAIVVAVVLAVSAGGFLFATKTDLGKGLTTKYFRTVIGPVAAKSTIEEFVKANLVPPGTEIATTDVSEEAGLYMAVVTVQGQEHPVYLSLDGTKLFPSALDTVAKSPEMAATQQPPAQDVPKSAKPVVKLFVMSYCPYGTQIEKGILPVISALGNKIDYKLEFVSYVMHEKKEIDENLRQYCIREQEPAKLSAYLGCFLKGDGNEGSGSACLKTTGVNVAKNATCVKATDDKFSVTKNYNDKSTYQGSFPTFLVDKADNDQYSVQGSPTLVINGITTESQRDPASLLKTICSAFDVAPKECGATLSSTAPAAGFGTAAAPTGAAGAAATTGGACATN